MDSHFAEWHRSAGIEPVAELLPKHWSGIEAFERDRESIIALTKIFYRLGSPDENVLTDFRLALQKQDPPFPMKDNDLHLAVLAGAALVENMNKGSQQLADLAALALVSAAAQNLRAKPPVPEIPETAARYLEKRRLSRSLSVPIESEGDGKLADEVQGLKRELAIVGEETNILWWMVSGYSRDLNEPLEEFPMAAALIAGKELADLTRLPPGPVAATAFLHRVIQSGKKKKVPEIIGIKDAINGAPITWREKYVNDYCMSVLDDVMPVSAGLKSSLTAPVDDAWLPAFERSTGISPQAKIARHVLAYQMFLEGSLHFAWKDLD